MSVARCKECGGGMSRLMTVCVWCQERKLVPIGGFEACVSDLDQRDYKPVWIVGWKMGLTTHEIRKRASCWKSAICLVFEEEHPKGQWVVPAMGAGSGRYSRMINQ